MDVKFHIVDYVIFVLFLLISAAFGICFAFSTTQVTPEAYLLGERKLKLLPVAISLMVTFQSAVSILGCPVEIFTYDTMASYFWLTICLTHVFQACIFVPLIYPLGLISVYEYFGRRFNSRSVQLLATGMGMLQTLLYMSFVLLAPALALESVAGIPLWMSIVVVGAVGTFYTSIGGMKTVIWTDVFQFVILFGGLLAVLILGTSRVGSIKRVLEIAHDGNRINFSTIDADPRVRHTVWGLLFAGIFQQLPFTCNQASVQRIASMKSARDAKISSLLNIPLVLIYGFLLTCTGLVLFAYFAQEECDPYLYGSITNRNQLVPYFVMHVFTNVPGLAGIFIAALFSGALSSLSSGINGLSANTVQDLLVNVLEDKSQFQKTMVAKLAVAVYGILSIGIAYALRYVPGPITQITQTSIGSVGGPITGMLFMGACFPQANWIGALVGGLLGMGINMWVTLGSLMYGNTAPVSPIISTSGCNGTFVPVAPSIESLNGTLYSANYTLDVFTMESTTSMANMTTPPGHLPIYDISYVYFGVLGFLVTIVTGMIVSILTGMDRGEPTEAEYIFPCLRDFWRAGYASVSTPRIYTVSKQKTKQDDLNNDLVDMPIRIQYLQSSWYDTNTEDPL